MIDLAKQNEMKQKTDNSIISKRQKLLIGSIAFSLCFLIGIIFMLLSTNASKASIFTNLFTLIFAEGSLLVSIIVAYFTTNLYHYQEGSLKSENTPYPYLSAIWGRFGSAEEREKIRNNNTYPVDADNLPLMMWYTYKDQEGQYLQTDITKLAVKLSTNNDLENTLINEIIDNQNSVCFSIVNNQPCIMFINDKIENGFVLEYCSAYIELKNYGALLKDLKVESITVNYKDDKVITLEGQQQKDVPLIIRPSETISLVYCQVTNNMKNSQCVVDDFVLSNYGVKYDLLKNRLTNNILNYKKINIQVSCRNFLDEEFFFNLIFEQQGCYYISRTELIHKANNK